MRDLDYIIPGRLGNKRQTKQQLLLDADNDNTISMKLYDIEYLLDPVEVFQVEEVKLPRDASL